MIHSHSWQRLNMRNAQEQKKKLEHFQFQKTDIIDWLRKYLQIILHFILFLNLQRNRTQDARWWYVWRKGIPIPILNYLNYLRPLSHGNCRFRIRGWAGEYLAPACTSILPYCISHTYFSFQNVIFSYFYLFTVTFTSHSIHFFTVDCFHIYV